MTPNASSSSVIPLLSNPRPTPLARRIIPCLDVHDGKVTRGVQFGRAEEGGLRTVGDPVEMALRYDDQGADEMVFFDITASAHGRASMIDVIERAADQCFMPLTVGGGIRTVDDMGQMLRAGADKVSLNTTAVERPEVITAAAEREQCDLIAMATHGHRWVKDFLFGSVADAVRHRTLVPVLMVRQQAVGE